MITYKPLMDLLFDRVIKKNVQAIGKTELMAKAGLSSATIAKIWKGEPVSLAVINALCRALDCRPGDVIDYVPGVGPAEPEATRKGRKRPEGAGRKKLQRPTEEVGNQSDDYDDLSDQFLDQQYNRQQEHSNHK